jgi:hypothetical protein
MGTGLSNSSQSGSPNNSSPFSIDERPPFPTEEELKRRNREIFLVQHARMMDEKALTEGLAEAREETDRAIEDFQRADKWKSRGKQRAVLEPIEESPEDLEERKRNDKINEMKRKKYEKYMELHGAEIKKRDEEDMKRWRAEALDRAKRRDEWLENVKKFGLEDANAMAAPPPNQVLGFTDGAPLMPRFVPEWVLESPPRRVKKPFSYGIPDYWSDDSLASIDATEEGDKDKKKEEDSRKKRNEGDRKDCIFKEYHKKRQQEEREKERKKLEAMRERRERQKQAEAARQQQRAARKAEREKAEKERREQESARRTENHGSADDRLKRIMVEYDHRWRLLVKGTNLPSEINAEELPWPLLEFPQTLECFNKEAIRAFIFHPLRAAHI